MLDPAGRLVRTWTGFTTVTGVAVGTDGSLYVSQLFAEAADGGAVPGVVTKVTPDGTRTSVDVPFPAGIAVDNADNVYVAAFSTASEDGLGLPDSSGQIWRLTI